MKTVNRADVCVHFHPYGVKRFKLKLNKVKWMGESEKREGVKTNKSIDVWNELLIRSQEDSNHSNQNASKEVSFHFTI